MHAGEMTANQRGDQADQETKPTKLIKRTNQAEGAAGLALGHVAMLRLPLAASWGELTTARGVSAMDTTVQRRNSHPGNMATCHLMKPIFLKLQLGYRRISRMGNY